MKEFIFNIVFIGVLFMLGKNTALACICDNCYNEYSVCELLHKHPDERNIILGKVIDSEYETWSVQVLDKIYGPETNNNLSLTMGVCGEPLYNSDNEFAEVNDTIIFLSQGYDGVHEIFTCERLLMTYKDGYVYGDINAASSEMTYDDFKNYINTGAYQDDLMCDVCKCSCSFPSFIITDEIKSFEYTLCSTLEFIKKYNINVLAARIKIKEVYEHGFAVEVTEVIQGNEDKTEIKVWGSLGQDCRTKTENLQLGKEYIAILYPIKDKGIQAEIEQEGDYELWKCGVHYLEIESETVYGKILSGTQEMPYTETKTLIENKFNGIANSECYDWIDVSIQERNPNQFQIFPNPASNMIYLEFSQSLNEPFDINIYNVKGQKVSTKTHPAKGQSNFTLDISQYNFSSGIYFVEIKFPDYSITQKMIIGK